MIHLGDHDPSGIDMTRDILDRLALFISADGAEPATINRIALNADQVRKYRPPSNPTKITDSRAQGYIAEYGRSSWELDALEPAVLEKLLDKTIAKYRDKALWEEMVEEEQTHVRSLERVAKKLK